jgi:Ca2+-binding RTX toxin-like protein
VQGRVVVDARHGRFAVDGMTQATLTDFEYFDLPESAGHLTFRGSARAETLDLDPKFDSDTWPHVTYHVRAHMAGGDDLVTSPFQIHGIVDGGSGHDRLVSDSYARVSYTIDLTGPVVQDGTTQLLLAGLEDTGWVIVRDGVSLSLVGTERADTTFLVLPDGTPSDPPLLDMLAGDDHVLLLEAGTVLGGRGNDTLEMRSGDPGVLHGDRGDDVLIGRGGDDVLVGGPGQDRADGGMGEDQCEAEQVTHCELPVT